jgi:hypothetical protein
MSKHHCHSCSNSHCDCHCHDSHHHTCGHSCHAGAASCDEHSHENSCDYPEYFLEVADEAWIEVLKEKIKDHIRKNDPKIDEVARIVAEANKEKWKSKMSKHKCCENYAHQLMHCFESCCSDSSCSTSKK